MTSLKQALFNRRRRAFLKTVGMLGAGLPIANLLQPEIAEAASAPPLRFISIFTPHGMVPEFWRPQGTESAFDINYADAMLAPFNKYKDKILVLDGLDFRVLYEYGTSGHEGGPCTFLTGSRMNKATGTELPDSLSIDQAIAAKIGGTTKLRSLELLGWAEFAGQSVYNTISFNTGGTRRPTRRNPADTFKELFPPVNTGDPQAAQRDLARKKSLLDYLVKDVTRLQKRLSGTEKQKLEQHLQALRDLEQGLVNASLVTCDAPLAPAPLNASALGNITRAPEIIKLQMDVIAQAIACDLTRVVTMPLAVPRMPWANLNVSLHDDIAHQIGAVGNPVRKQLVTVQRWFGEQVVYLMDRLASITEGSGTALDNTMILWGNELGNPAEHASHGVPTLICGGTQGKFRMGRYLQLRPGKNPLQGWSGFGQKAPNAVAHNKLLVSIAHAFGVEGETFGHPDYAGELPGLV
ncbi:MAG: DUF1552 domain-containing protein [Myxococcaceae bacterium]|nr:DUF1552 domain-containing protein [Myxococcaceae bacterium]